MLFIGVGMVASVSRAHNTLVAIHKPLGIALLLLVVLRVAVRITRGAPPLPADMATPQRIAAKASHLVLYALMVAMPLIGWGMLSAAGYPVTLYGPLHLPPIAPHDVALFALLRALHTWLAFTLFATVLLHLAAALFHGLIRRDGVFSSMARSDR
jgi:cytochrome b561